MFFEFGADLLQLLEPKKEERILNIGCGTGDLTKKIAGSFFAGIPQSKHEHLLSNIEDKLKEDIYRDGFWYADYKRLRVKAIQE